MLAFPIGQVLPDAGFLLRRSERFALPLPCSSMAWIPTGFASREEGFARARGGAFYGCVCRAALACRKQAGDDSVLSES